MRERKNRRTATKPVSLGPGVHAAIVELDAAPTFRVRTTTGVRATAALSPAVDRALIEECLREGRPVLLVDGDQGIVIIGAVQTARVPTVAPDGSFALDADTLVLRAARALEIDVGEASLVLRRNGVIELRGDRLAVNVDALVRFLSARVELP